MCTVVLLRRPDHPWPLILGANRDEMRTRPWQPPGRHWPDRADVVAGFDELAEGTWLGLNDYGVVACVLNRPATLGPEVGKRSRGELPLEALDHAEASVATDALGHLSTEAYRPFNMLIADAREAFWIAVREGEATPFIAPVPTGLSMLTAHDLNDRNNSLRVRHHLPMFETADAPAPDSDDWQAWQNLLERRDSPPNAGPESAMSPDLPSGFATTSSSLIALPAPKEHIDNKKVSAVWKFRSGKPGETPWTTIEI